MSEKQPVKADREKHALLDDRVIEFVKGTPYEDLLVEMDGSKSSGKSDKISFAKEWFSEKEDYRGDTFLSPEQVYALSILRNLNSMYAEIGDTQELVPFLDDIIDDFERYAISIDGFARKQEANVLRSMFGDTGELTPEEKGTLMQRYISNPPPQND